MATPALPEALLAKAGGTSSGSARLGPVFRREGAGCPCGGPRLESRNRRLCRCGPPSFTPTAASSTAPTRNRRGVHGRRFGTMPGGTRWSGLALSDKLRLGLSCQLLRMCFCRRRWQSSRCVADFSYVIDGLQALRAAAVPTLMLRSCAAAAARRSAHCGGACLGARAPPAVSFALKATSLCPPQRGSVCTRCGAHVAPTRLAGALRAKCGVPVVYGPGGLRTRAGEVAFFACASRLSEWASWVAAPPPAPPDARPAGLRTWRAHCVLRRSGMRCVPSVGAPRGRLRHWSASRANPQGPSRAERATSGNWACTLRP